MAKFLWLEKAEILAIHYQQLREHGGGYGLRDEGLLESALARPQNAFSYGETDLHTLAMLYCSGICRNHPFVDGNKRTAWIATRLFLLMHGYEVFDDDYTNTIQMLKFAAGDVTDKAMADWLRANTEKI